MKKICVIACIISLLCSMCNVSAMADYIPELIIDIEGFAEAGADEGEISLMSASTVQTYSKASQGNTYLSNNFQVKEFACKDGSDTVYIDSELVVILQNIRDHFGKSVTINSGYRTPSWNAKQGGAANSYHVKGMAADIKVSGVSPATVAKYAEDIGVRGIGLYGSFVHVDTRPSKFYWYSSSVSHRSTFGGRFNSKPYDSSIVSTPSSNNPQGWVDLAEGGIGTVRVAGWAFDYDAPNDPIAIHVYIDGKCYIPGGADAYRPDVASVYGVGSYHGFDFTFNVDSVGSHTVDVYAINNVSGQHNPKIGTKNVVIQKKEPVSDFNGNFEDAEGGFGTFSVGGWAYDKLNPNEQLEIHAYVGGKAGSGAPCYNLGVANLKCTDVNNTYGVGEYHGFETTKETDKRGKQILYLYAVNASKGTNAFIGSKEVTISEPYVTCLDCIDFENNKLYMQGWALYHTSNTDIEVRYQIDDMPEVVMNRYSNDRVHQTYPQYPAGNERFNASVYGKDLSNGEHEVVIRAYIGGKCVQELGSKTFTSNADHIPKKTITKSNHIYSVFDVKMDWIEAGKLAENKGGYLITITSQEEQDIVDELLEYGASAQYWIGATDESEEGENSEWSWMTDEIFNYTNWHAGEPNNTNNNEHYAGVYSNGTWNNFPNSYSDIGYIMETEITGVPTAYIENDGHYYYLYDDEVDWHGAKAFCEAMGGHLVTINDKKEQALVQSLVSQGVSGFDGYYIGATNNGSDETWKWVTDEKFGYTNWNSGEPSNTNGIERYAEMLKAGTWNDRESFNRDSKNGFILEIETDETYTAKTEYAGNTYMRIDKSLSWEDAKTYCESIGGHLATITDDEEQEAVEDLFVRGIDTLRSAYSLGATDADNEGVWTWVTDEEFDYDNWDAGEPDNGTGGGVQNYLSIYTTGSKFGLWDDIQSFSSNPYDRGFVCEIESKDIKPTPTPDAGEVVIPKPDISTPKPDVPDDTPEIDETLSTVTVGTVSAEGGDAITIPVSISNNQGICESKFVIRYDNTRLTPTKVNLGEAFADGSIQADIENVTENRNSLTVTWENSSIADNRNNGVMFNVEFAVAENAAPGMIPVAVTEEQLEVINSSGEDININLVGGGIAIAWPIISVGNVKTQPGRTITVPVSIENNTGINAFGFTVEYDNTALTPTEIIAGEVIDGKGSIQSNLDDTGINRNKPDEVTVTWLSDDLENNTMGNGELFGIKFTVNSSADIGFYPVKIKYTDGDITNTDGAEIGLTTSSGGVAVEEITVMYGDVNCDGRVNIIDIVLLRKYNANLSVEISEEGLLAADVNCDGKIDSKDILLMRKYVAKWQGIKLGR